MSVSPFDHPLLSALLGDAEIAENFSLAAELAEILVFEVVLAEAEAAEGLIPAAAATAIAAAVKNFHPDIARLADGTARDGVVVPELVAQLRVAVGASHAQHLHFAATSQDAIDTGLAIRLRRVANELDHRLLALVHLLDRLGAVEGKRELMGHTRMQRARPITLGQKIAHWRDPLVRHRQRLEQLGPRLLVLQFGGAVGNRAELGERGDAVAMRMAEALKLARSERARHVERDGVAEFAGWLSLVTGSLGKLGADVMLMAQNEVHEVRIADGGGSSAMPEKSNPIAAEILVTLARFNAAQLSAVHTALVHENERSGSAWTLEWMTLPQMAVACGAALRQALRLIESLRFEN
jgi:3-carboxy-cis,cis-muconate cycloisomerase